jgi:methionyl-tRNA synthetase
MTKRQYITTAIDYPNAAPHMGHVLEKVLADVCARWMRLRGDDVRFQIGTDEHGIKIQQTAQKQGITPSELVEKNVPLFQDLYSRLGVSYDYFIRTTDQKIHWPTVQALWRKLRDAGALEKRTYTGLYCTGCERFVTKKDLVDGKCPDHGIPPQEVKEENWFFLLARETQRLKSLLTDSYIITPSFRAPETFALLESGLEDVSFSRPVSSLSWGIPVPDEEGQTMYVWCDALTNYISSLGYLTDHEQREWWDEAEVTHVIGKDIARFHALIWPAMLLQGGIRTPDRLLIHGFLTSEGQKMSKSLGNVVVPDEAIGKYGVDALRFYLSHEIPVGNDGDFTWTQFDGVYNGMLRNQLGNLLNRVMVLLKKADGTLDAAFPVTMKLDEAVEAQKNVYGEKMDAFETHLGIQAAMRIVDIGNQMMQQHQPWSKEHTPETRKALLTEFAELLRQAALLLLPFIPETALKISLQLGVPYADKMLSKDFVITEELSRWGGCREWKAVGEPSILFAPVE